MRKVLLLSLARIEAAPKQSEGTAYSRKPMLNDVSALMLLHYFR